MRHGPDLVSPSMSSSTTEQENPREPGAASMVVLTSARLRHDSPATSGRVFRYGVVRRFRVGAHKTELQVESAVGEHIWLEFDSLPDRSAADVILRSGLKPLSIMLEVGAGGDVDCTVICTSSSGPARHKVPLRLALSLCADGRHTVVTRPNR